MMKISILLLLGLVLASVGCVTGTTPPVDNSLSPTPTGGTSVNPNGGTPLPDYTPPADTPTPTDSPASGTVPEGSGAVVSPSDVPVADAGVNVSMQNGQFIPSTITISAGQTIHFTNTGGSTHDLRVYNETSEPYAKTEIAAGQTIDVTINEAGTYTMECFRHLPNMTGTIVVNP